MPESFRDPLILLAAASAALTRRDWQALAALCDPWSLSAFREQILEQYQRTSAPSPVTVDTLRRVQPDMPQAVAEYQIAQHRKQAQERLDRIDDQIAGVASYEELIALSPAELFSRWLEAHSLGAQVKKLLRQHPAVANAPELSLSSIPEHSIEPIGVVLEQDWAYVLYRDKDLSERIKPVDQTGDPAGSNTFDNLRWRLVRIAPAHRQPNGEWRLIAEHHFLIAQQHVSSIQLERR